MGILFATIALLCWGLGDFLIEKSTRKLGDWVSLFYITVIAGVGLLPFVQGEIYTIFQNSADLSILLVASGILLFISLVDFEALKIGKISVVEPVFSFEVLVTSFLGFYFIKEKLTLMQGVLIGTLIIGIILVSIKHFEKLKTIRWEKGVFYALITTFGMGIINFMFGVGSRRISPLMINWFTSIAVAGVCLAYIIFQEGGFAKLKQSWKNDKKLIIGVGIVDNAAWVAFAYSTLHMPIAIATGVTESYIALAAILGLTVNKERLRLHQWIGLVVVVISAVVLGTLT